MGVADIIPGVSGGTIALITGIYQKLINNINAVDLELVKLFFKNPFQAIKKSFQKLDVPFLILVFGGILISIKAFAGIISNALENYPIIVWSLFAGLILSSSLWMIIEELLKNKTKIFLGIIVCFLGIIIGYLISSLLPAHQKSFSSSFFLFIAGFIAISAMILPGISGSFLLVLMGQYKIITTAIKELDFFVILPFSAGCLFGIIIMGKMISWLLKRYYFINVLFLLGLMLGCLKKIYPWKIAKENVFPSIYEELNGTGSANLFYAIIFCLIGILFSILIFYLKNFKKQIKNKLVTK